VQDAKQISIGDFALFEKSKVVNHNVPVIYILGGGMNSGKTALVSRIARILKSAGLTLCGCKLSGVAARRDLDSMIDHGVGYVASFVDGGLPSTCIEDKNLVVEIAKGTINHIVDVSKVKPDIIIAELGEGLFGKYGVRELLLDDGLKKLSLLNIGCASDVASAVKIVSEMRFIGNNLDIISGPVTDTQVGRQCILNHLDGVDEDQVNFFNLKDGNNAFISVLMQKIAHYTKCQ
jgi:hypothetical protein